MDYCHPWSKTVLIDEGLSLHVEEMVVTFEGTGEDVVEKHDYADWWADEAVKSDVA